MGRVQKRMAEKIKKKLAKSKKIPKEKKDEVLAAFDNVDLDALFGIPGAMEEVTNDPSKLINYTKKEETETVETNEIPSDENK